jgi:histidyl-tRNA synthetase
LGEAAAREAFKLLDELRRNTELAACGLIFEGGFFEKKLGAQLTIASRLECSHCIILGDTELARGELVVKALQKGTQESLAKERLIPHLSAIDA